ncbi:MerR family transcriptional regulator [Shewanella avicenniae]|uniref:MerR family transcriptional regulator n=1 Tax=Shewanella avicenniae TaxID=2814294 RepID=A0ABX7QVX7_9GAMM|nr:MerR family transcriptional regulator [Shewanella avicenniae]QSX34805.1 MerR family transcriptional regulator [Shewanella avicenniae]
MQTKYSINELATLVDISVRTLRFYLQKGLISAPHGNGRGAWYDADHLEQLIKIKRWQTAGLSLERIQALLAQSNAPELPVLQPKPGDIQVVSHLHLANGLTLMIDPSAANLSSEQLRTLAQALINTYQQVTHQDAQQGVKQDDIRDE